MNNWLRLMEWTGLINNYLILSTWLIMERKSTIMLPVLINRCLFYIDWNNVAIVMIVWIFNNKKLFSTNFIVLIWHWFPKKKTWARVKSIACFKTDHIRRSNVNPSVHNNICFPFFYYYFVNVNDRSHGNDTLYLVLSRQ